MKFTKALPFLAVSVFCLAGCASKVDYDKFHEQAGAVKAHPYTKAAVKVDGSTTLLGASIAVKATIHYTYGNGWAIVSEDQTTDNASAIALAEVAILDSAVLVGEDEDATYYVGGGFKVTYKNGDEKKYNEYGLRVSSNIGGTKISISYSK